MRILRPRRFTGIKIVTRHGQKFGVSPSPINHPACAPARIVMQNGVLLDSEALQRKPLNRPPEAWTTTQRKVDTILRNWATGRESAFRAL
jgi:hypothetical protein